MHLGSQRMIVVHRPALDQAGPWRMHRERYSLGVRQQQLKGRHTRHPWQREEQGDVPTAVTDSPTKSRRAALPRNLPKMLDGQVSDPANLFLCLRLVSVCLNPALDILPSLDLP